MSENSCPKSKCKWWYGYDTDGLPNISNVCLGCSRIQEPYEDLFEPAEESWEEKSKKIIHKSLEKDFQQWHDSLPWNKDNKLIDELGKLQEIAMNIYPPGIALSTYLIAIGDVLKIIRGEVDAPSGKDCAERTPKPAPCPASPNGEHAGWSRGNELNKYCDCGALNPNWPKEWTAPKPLPKLPENIKIIAVDWKDLCILVPIINEILDYLKATAVDDTTAREE